MLTIQIALTVLVIVSLFVHLRTGICLYLAYFFLVPYCQLNVFGIYLSWNFINIAILGAYVLDCNKKKVAIKLDWKYISPFVIFYLLQLLEMPFQEVVPLDYAFNAWRYSLFALALPFVILSCSQYDPKLSKYCFRTMCIVGIVIVVYAFSLIPLQGINPYIMEMADLNDMILYENQFGEQEGRMMIKISSVFTHPMTFGLFLGLFLIYMWSCYNKQNVLLVFGLIIGVISCIFLCGIRTPIAAFLVTMAIWLLLHRNFKMLIYGCIFGFIGYHIILYIPGLSETIASMTDSSSRDVGGSSLNLRISQLESAIRETENYSFFGKGFDYTQLYMSTKGSHPTLMSFESLIFVIMFNSGLLGFVIWGNFFYKLIKTNISKLKITENGYLIIVLSIYYLAYTIITGEYDYFKYFAIFYSLIIIKLREKQLIINSK